MIVSAIRTPMDHAVVNIVLLSVKQEKRFVLSNETRRRFTLVWSAQRIVKRMRFGSKMKTCGGKYHTR